MVTNIPPHIRRVVTRNDDSGRAVVTVDEISRNVISRRPLHESCVIWSTGSFPSDNSSALDGGARSVASTDPNGSVLRLVEYGPGVAPRNHRTESIDHAVVIAGEIEMEIDGATVPLRQGDVLVRRGTIHNWNNHGTAPCVIAFVLIGATSVERAGRVLGAFG